MEAKGKRIFNNRPLVFIAVAMIIGILVGEAIYGEHLAFIALPIIAFIASLAALLCFERSRRFAYIPVAFIIGFALISIQSSAYDNLIFNRVKGVTQTVEATATVASPIYEEDGALRFIVSDIAIGSEKISGKARVYVYGGSVDYNVGDIIRLKCDIEVAEHKKFDHMYAAKAVNRQYYMLFANEAEKLVEGKPKFPVNVQCRIATLLYGGMDADSAEICKGLLLGDTFGLDDELREQISAAGISHLLAVSGLHISTLAALLYAILKKLKVKPVVSFVIVTLLTLGYSMLCSFTASSLRAVIMFAVFSFADISGRKRDPLNALALSMTLIFLVRPNSLFNMGFLLSFSSIYGITVLNRPFLKAGRNALKLREKRNKDNKFLSLGAMMMSATFGALPFTAIFVGQFPIFFFISGVFILPYMMLVYILLAIVSIFAFITGISVLFVPINYMILPVRAYMTALSALPFATIPIAATTIGAAIYLGVSAIGSRFIFFSRRNKIRIALSMASLWLLVTALAVLI